ncbi:MAG: DUF6265 family protein [Bacteroidota bacterium]
MKTILLFFLSCLIVGATQAQNTLSLDPDVGSPEASIDDVAWIAGHWMGEKWGGQVEEIWAPPIGDAMMGSFRFVSENKAVFYELLTITETEGTLLLQLKHFHGDLKGWEEKEETVDFKLVKLTEDAAYFDGLTFRKHSEDSMEIIVLAAEEGQPAEELDFLYSLYQPE